MTGECEEGPFVPGYVLALQYNRYLSGNRGPPSSGIEIKYEHIGPIIFMNFRFIAVEEQQLSIRRSKREQSETLRPTARQEAHRGQEHGGEEDVAIPAAIARGIRRREAPRGQATQENRAPRGMSGHRRVR